MLTLTPAPITIRVRAGCREHLSRPTSSILDYLLVLPLFFSVFFSFFLLSWFHCEPSNRVNWGLRCFESFLLSQHSGDFRVLQTVHMHSLVLVLCASSQGHTVTCSLQGCPALQTHWCGHAWDPASVSRTVSMLLLLLIICPENV